MYGAIDVQKSLIKAKSFLVEELATGNLEAALEVAQLQLDYPRDSFDVYNGLETLRRMADDGWLDASFNLAYFYLNFEASNASEIVPEFKPDYKEAFSHLLELMKTSYGLSNYSGLYSYKWSSKFSSDQGEELVNALDKTAKNPSHISKSASIDAANLLADILIDGMFKPSNQMQGIEYLTIAADDYKDPVSSIKLGLLHQSLENYELAERYLLQGLEDSSVEKQAFAHNSLGYHYNSSMPMLNFKRAAFHYERSIDLYDQSSFTSDAAPHNLAMLYLLADLDLSAMLLKQNIFLR